MGDIEQEEGRFRALFESMTQGVVYQDAGGQITAANPAAQELLGLSLDELRGRASPDPRWRATDEQGRDFPGDRHPAMVALRTGEVVRGTVMGVFNPRAGEHRWLLVDAVPQFRDGATKPHEVYTLFIDITYRKQMEEAVREREEQTRFMAEVMPQMGWTTAADGRHEYFNRRWYEFTGAEPGETDGWEWASRLHPEDRERALAVWRRSLETGDPYEVEYRLHRHDGVYRRQLARAMPRRNEENEVIQWVGTCTDIHDHLEAAEALRQSEARLRRMVNSGLLGVLYWDDRGRITDANDTFLGMIGYSREQLEGNAIEWAALTPAEYAPLDEQAGRELQAAGVSGLYEKEIIRKDGVRVPLLVGAAMLDETRRDGMAFTLDITRQKRFETELRAFNESLEERIEERTVEIERVNRELMLRNRELQDFAYVASHDLQEPLRKIQAFSGIIGAEYRHALDDEALHYLERIQDAASRMTSLIRDLLAFSRVATRGEAFVRIDLKQIVQDVLSDLEVRIQDTGADIEVHPLPEIEADPTQMQQLFQNLIANALKFHRPEAAPHIVVSAPTPSDATDFVRIIVRDNGIGFDEKYLDRIFSPFQRLHGRGEYEGTGMGLAICRRIVERHHGRIGATSAPGSGSTFIVELPVRNRLAG